MKNIQMYLLSLDYYNIIKTSINNFFKYLTQSCQRLPCLFQEHIRLAFLKELDGDGRKLLS